MFQSDFADDHRDVPAPRRAANRLIAALLVVILCFCAICAKFLIDARNSAWRGARETTASLVAAIELDTLLNIESFDLSLQAVVDNLKLPGIDRNRSGSSPARPVRPLCDGAAPAGHLRSRRDRPCSFRFQDGRPQTGRSCRPRLFSVSRQGRRIRAACRRPDRHPYHRSAGRPAEPTALAPDGSFAGVVVGGLRLSYFQDCSRIFRSVPTTT